MIRVTDLALPLDHAPDELEAALCAKLGIAPARLERFSIARRGNDARKKAAIKLVYSIDAVVSDEADSTPASVGCNLVQSTRSNHCRAYHP